MNLTGLPQTEGETTMKKYVVAIILVAGMQTAHAAYLTGTSRDFCSECNGRLQGWIDQCDK
jgi:hypothetical protein